MTDSTDHENCPRCGESSSVRSKLVLIDGKWVPGPGKEYYYTTRVDKFLDEILRETPLEQFMDGFYCNRCNIGFISELGLKQPQQIRPSRFR
jgi:hypothetical protein